MYTSTVNPAHQNDYKCYAGEQLNSYGMRCAEPVPNSPTNVFLGCSFTFGEAVQAELTWPRLVQTHCEDAQYQNLSELGASANLCYHMLSEATELRIKRIFFLAPYPNRMHIANNWGSWSKFNIGSYKHFTADRRFATQLTDDRYTQHLWDMASKAITQLAQEKNAQLIMIPVTFTPYWNDHQAEDHKHPGPNSHAEIAERFISRLRQKSRLR